MEMQYFNFVKNTPHELSFPIEWFYATVCESILSACMKSGLIRLNQFSQYYKINVDVEPNKQCVQIFSSPWHSFMEMWYFNFVKNTLHELSFSIEWFYATVCESVLSVCMKAGLIRLNQFSCSVSKSMWFWWTSHGWTDMLETVSMYLPITHLFAREFKA